MIRTSRTLLAAAIALAGLVACSAQDSDVDPAVARGKSAYGNVCVACHHGNPAEDGPLGPAVAGASRELLEAKIMRGEYPPGYQPRRPTTTMPRYEYLVDSLEDLAAYLDQTAN